MSLSVVPGLILLILGYAMINPAMAKTNTLPSWLVSEPSTGTISAINNDLTLKLGQTNPIKLANIVLIPALQREALEKGWNSHTVHIHPTSPKPDRHNRLSAHVIRLKDDHPLWLQADLVEKGMAQVSVSPNNQSCFSTLLKLEHQARKEQKGEWAKDKEFKVYRADELDQLNQIQQGKFVIVKGNVLTIGRSGQNTFINFSKEWQKDFTVLIKTRLLHRKTLNWPNIKTLPGKEVEVRGWLDHWNGPMIRVEVPEQLQRLEQKNH